jgi:urease accessory protein
MIAGRKIKFALAVAALATASPAHAHLMNTGFGPFYDGLSHLFVTPEDLLPVIALALLGGQLGPRFGRAVLFALPLSWIVGSFAGGLMSPALTFSIATAVMTIGLGALVAINKPLPMPLVVGLAALLGLMHGCLSGTELSSQHSVGLVTAGVATALFVLTALLAGQVAVVRAPWIRVAVQVGGSWIAAVGLLMLGWAVRPH